VTKAQEKPTTEWENTTKRFVCFLDILGFKDMVMRKSHSEIYEMLSRFSKAKNKLQNLTKSNLQVYYDTDNYIVTFSDSIVIFSKSDRFEDLEYLLFSTSWLFNQALKNNIQLKGGLAHGEVSLNKDDQIYFGQAIIDAYNIEEDVNYLGVVAHNSIDEYLSNQNLIDSDLFQAYLFESKTPLKSGHITHHNLNWFLDFSSISNKNPQDEKIKEIDAMLMGFKKQSSGTTRRYSENTLDFFHNNLVNKKIIIEAPI
jgi:hypothetical protein